MAESPLTLKALGIWVMLSGLLLILSSLVVVFIEEAIGIMIGIVYMLALVVFGMYVTSSGRIILRTEMGGWTSSLQGVAAGMVCTLSVVVLLLEGFDAAEMLSIVGLTFIGSVLALVGEGLAIVVVYRSKQLFIPDEAEIKRTERILSEHVVTTVSDCPACGEVVEATWDTCPYCGHRLPKMCAQCGTELEEFASVCSACGAAVVVPEDTLREIAGLRKRAELETNPESRSMAYAKLGDRYAKAGMAGEALTSYDLAIRDTSYTRKKTLLMVKMARIYRITGERNEAEKALDKALSMDRKDYAGAAGVRASLNEA